MLGHLERIAASEAPALIEARPAAAGARRPRHPLQRAAPPRTFRPGQLWRPSRHADRASSSAQRGAFTDARESRRGLVAEAEGGTLFLDEVDALSAKAQVTLLRFLRDQHYRPVGTATERRTDLRLIAAANRPLDALVAQHQFRADLLYRLKILHLVLPPLRARGDDKSACSRAALRGPLRCRTARDACRQYPATRAWMRRYAWPGNVRESENWVHRQFLILPRRRTRPRRRARARTCRLRARRPIAPRAFAQAKAEAVRSFESDYLRRMLDATGGNVTVPRAARRQGAARLRQAAEEARPRRRQPGGLIPTRRVGSDPPGRPADPSPDRDPPSCARVAGRPQQPGIGLALWCGTVPSAPNCMRTRGAPDPSHRGPSGLAPARCRLGGWRSALVARRTGCRRVARETELALATLVRRRRLRQCAWPTATRCTAGARRAATRRHGGGCSGGRQAIATNKEQSVMVQVSFPGVYIQEKSSGVRTITGVATSIAAFVDAFPRGPRRGRAVPELSPTSSASSEASAQTRPRATASSSSSRMAAANAGSCAFDPDRRSAGQQRGSRRAPSSAPDRRHRRRDVPHRRGAPDARAIATNPGVWGTTSSSRSTTTPVRRRPPSTSSPPKIVVENGRTRVVTQRDLRNLTMGRGTEQRAVAVINAGSRLVQLDRDGMAALTVPPCPQPLGDRGPERSATRWPSIPPRPVRPSASNDVGSAGARIHRDPEPAARPRHAGAGLRRAAIGALRGARRRTPNASARWRDRAPDRHRNRRVAVPPADSQGGRRRRLDPAAATLDHRRPGRRQPDGARSRRGGAERPATPPRRRARRPSIPVGAAAHHRQPGSEDRPVRARDVDLVNILCVPHAANWPTTT